MVSSGPEKTNWAMREGSMADCGAERGDWAQMIGRVARESSIIGYSAKDERLIQKGPRQ